MDPKANANVPIFINSDMATNHVSVAMDQVAKSLPRYSHFFFQLHYSYSL